MRLLRAVLTALLLVAAFAPAARSAGTDAHAVSEMLRAGRQSAVLADYFGCGQTPGIAYARIAAGDPAWVAIAERVLTFSDACYTEGIQASLGTAMRMAPRTVLPLVDKTPLLAADRICLPFISDEQAVSAQLAQLNASKRAIQRVHGKTWARGRAACLRLIQSTEEAVQKNR